MTCTKLYYLVYIQIKELTLAEQALLGNEVPQMEEDNEVVISPISVGREE